MLGLVLIDIYVKHYFNIVDNLSYILLFVMAVIPTKLVYDILTQT